MGHCDPAVSWARLGQDVAARGGARRAGNPRCGGVLVRHEAGGDSGGAAVGSRGLRAASRPAVGRGGVTAWVPSTANPRQ